MTETPRSSTISPKLSRIAEMAKAASQVALTALAHFIDGPWLREAYARTRKSGATGVDGQTASSYAEDLESNLQSLEARLRSETYRAPAVRRVHIPKGNSGETRPIGIPTFEDKVAQRAVAMALEAVYETEFLDCSYGFRPGRSAHQALESLLQATMTMKGGWVLEIDVRKFFDTLDHGHLRRILRRRVRDGVLLRTIDKWLKAGVMEGVVLSMPEAGSPQGGVISPLLANVYLHEVLDAWFHREVLPRLKGRAHLVRYADDAVMVFEVESDARRVLDILPKRFGRYGLTLHPTKTRLVPFRRPRLGDGPKSARWAAFDFLGLTHVWGRSRRGRWIVKRRTANDRFSRSLTALRTWCRDHRHEPVVEQWRMLVAKLRGHYGYFGIRGNSRQLQRYREAARRAWQMWLSRRSQKSRVPWPRMAALLRRFPLPPARLLGAARAT